MNQINFLEFGPLIFLEKEPSASALSTIHYQYYKSMDEVLATLEPEQDELQCVLGISLLFSEFLYSGTAAGLLTKAGSKRLCR